MANGRAKRWPSDLPVRVFIQYTTSFSYFNRIPTCIRSFSYTARQIKWLYMKRRKRSTKLLTQKIRLSSLSRCVSVSISVFGYSVYRLLSPLQDAYHELHNDLDGVKEKMIEDCIQWVEKHLNQGTGATQARL